jgi:dTDP-4-amino-4,6-dideoxygalactose transaminase
MQEQLRQTVAKTYLQKINNPLIELPIVADFNAHVWHLFVIKTNQRAPLDKYLSDNGVQSLIHYPIPPHQQDAYQEWKGMSFPISEKIHGQVLSIPISSVMRFEQVLKVIHILNSFEKKSK